MIDVLTICIPEYAELDAAQRAYWALNVENNDVPEDVVTAAKARIRVAMDAWKRAAHAVRDQERRSA